MEILDYPNFKITISDTESITIEGKDKSSITYMPGNSEVLRKFVGTIWAMSSLEALPEKIESHPFRARFDEDGEIEVSLKTHHYLHEPGLKFTFGQCDNLVQMIDEAIAKIRDMMIINPAPDIKPVDQPFSGLIEGKV